MKNSNGYRDVIRDERSLEVFLQNMAKFDQHFCELMTAGVEFTLRLEVRGVDGELMHCRVNKDEIDHNRVAQSKIDLGRKNAKVPR